MNKAIQLLDTNRPRIANPLLEFFHHYMTAHAKITEIQQGDPLQDKVQNLTLVLFQRLKYPDWFLEMEGHMPEPNDYSDGRLDEQKLFR